MPLVSILVPCRNAAPTLAAALESCLGQSGVDKEIIVVDDGSTDASAEIARRFRQSGVKLLRGPGINASAARNMALRESRGDYIQYLDADDCLGADKLRLQVEELESHPGCVATARWGRFRLSLEDVVFANDDQLHDWTPLEWLVYHCGQHQMMHPAAWLVPRRVAEQAGPWDERLTLNDDGEYFARVVAKSRMLRCVPRAQTFYRTAEGKSLSKSRGRGAFKSLWLSIESTTNVMLRLSDTTASRRAAADMCQRFIYEVYPSVPELRTKAGERIRVLGGSHARPDFGPRARLLARLCGWRAALIFSRFSRKGTPV